MAGTGSFHNIMNEQISCNEGSIVIAKKLNEILGINVEMQKKKFLASEEICKKCLRSVMEMVQMEEKLRTTREELVSSFFNTASKFNKNQAAAETGPEESCSPPSSSSSAVNLYNYGPRLLLPHPLTLIRNHENSFGTPAGILQFYPGFNEANLRNQTANGGSEQEKRERFGRPSSDYGSSEGASSSRPERADFIPTFSGAIDSYSEGAMSPRPFDQCSLASSFSLKSYESSVRSKAQYKEYMSQLETARGLDLSTEDRKAASASSAPDETASDSTKGSSPAAETPPAAYNAAAEQEKEIDLRKPVKKRKMAEEHSDSENREKMNRSDENDSFQSHYEDQVDNSNSDITDGDT